MNRPMLKIFILMLICLLPHLGFSAAKKEPLQCRQVDTQKALQQLFANDADNDTIALKLYAVSKQSSLLLSGCTQKKPWKLNIFIARKLSNGSDVALAHLGDEHLTSYYCIPRRRYLREEFFPENSESNNTGTIRSKNPYPTFFAGAYTFSTSNPNVRLYLTNDKEGYRVLQIQERQSGDWSVLDDFREIMSQQAADCK